MSVEPDNVSRTITFNGGCPQVPVEINERLGKDPNSIRTSRFTILTWIPKSLFMQFQRTANLFFLFVCFMVFFPFSPTNPVSTAAPFILVLSFTCCKDWFEDRRKQRDDKAENARPVKRYNAPSRAVIEDRCKNLRVGDIVVTHKDEVIPADLLVLLSSEGQAYISTSNLDGEANLKIRVAPDVISAVTEAGTATKAHGEPISVLSAECTRALEILGEAKANVSLDAPKAALGDFGGRASCHRRADPATGRIAPIFSECRLSADNFLPRGCVQRNTLWVISVVAYTGPETKSFLNIVPAAAKVSNLQVYMNRAVGGLVVSLALFCLYAAVVSEFVNEKNEHGFVVRFLIYWIVLYQVVPISLYVCFEVLKIILGIRINLDKQMVCPRTEKGAFARTADLVEELGQVNYLFSDKTGTLTDNDMIFAKCFVGNSLLGVDIGDFRSNPPDSVAAGVEDSMRILSSGGADARDLLWYWQCLAVCGNVQVELNSSGEPTYSGSSSDEVAFLDAAKKCGVVLQSREKLAGGAWRLVVNGPTGACEFTVTGEIEFTSERRRMSVICEHNEEIYLISKGADSSMEPLCSARYPTAFQDSLDRYSSWGLRTLAVASRRISAEDVQAWRQAMLTASSQADRDAAAAILEHSMSPVGVTAIEDKLQDGVPECLEFIKAMGIRVFVLTGDKVETAVEIGRSCGLFRKDTSVAYAVGPTNMQDCMSMLKTARDTIVDTGGGFVFDGNCMKFVMESDEATDALYSLASMATCCMGCRLSPAQKRFTVGIVKARNTDSITMAIGDGANDVSMIQGAHVGIGIRGKEGVQAVQVSDIAISQFRFLHPLLICHGRRNYRRVSVFLCYYIYKHLLLAVGDVIWAHQYAFCGCIAYSEWLSSAYNVAFSSLPVLVAMSIDVDVPDAVALARPGLYEEGLRRMWFNAPIFTAWMVSGFWHGALAWLTSSLVLDPPELGSVGVAGAPRSVEFWSQSLCSFSLIVIFIQIRLFMVSMSPTSIWLIAAVVFSVLAYVVTLFMLGETPLGTFIGVKFSGVPTLMVTSSRHLMLIFLTPLVLAIDFVVLKIIRHMSPGPLLLARAGVAQGAISADGRTSTGSARCGVE
eukprot:TRINITY_DN20359_c0_g2_i2.p1 TRINITY_DN20359_c0_g2~~TRINITY_DN20359_c0_g2_i2.p1  ORF type:complete len:1103 (+),score=204.72 TRINITY_DN20359_c0_g2_i2:75-3383(+)